MSSNKQTPVIVLAYANERTAKGFLRELNNEMKGTLKAIEYAVQDRYVFPKIIPAVTQGDIAEVFQSAWYEGRVKIFHYAGHADEDELWVEKDDGGNQAMFSLGLSQFLGTQKSLQLVFLNGCATLKHAQLLLDRGIPAVIATSRVIDDVQARKFSAFFYQGLASGIGIKDAFDEAEGLMLAEYGETGLPATESGSSTRTLMWEDWEEPTEKEELKDESEKQPLFPWRLFLRETSGWVAGEWKLFANPMISGGSTSQVKGSAYIGKTIGNYKIESYLGQGGLGLVFKAVHESLGTEAAIKVTYPALSGFEKLRQIIIGGNIGLSKITHPNVVKFLDIHEENLFGDPQLFIVMEFIRGESLDKLNFGIAGMGQDAVRKLIDFGVELCDAVTAIHETQYEDENKIVREGFVHGNIRRRKILVDQENIPKLTDFMFTNIDKHPQVKLDIPDEVLERKSTEKMENYYPPEVLRGENSVNKQTDIFGIGAIFLEVILNKPLSDVRFSSEDDLHNLFSKQNRRFPKKLSKIIFKSLHPDPKQRYQKMREMLDELSTHQSLFKRIWNRITRG